MLFSLREVSLEDGIHCTSLRIIPVLFVCCQERARLFVQASAYPNMTEELERRRVEWQWWDWWLLKVPVEDGPGAGSLTITLFDRSCRSHRAFAQFNCSMMFDVCDQSIQINV